MRRHMLDISKLANSVRTKRGRNSLRETAEEIGDISPSTLSRIENGKHYPGLDTFSSLCDWMNMPMDYFRSDPPDDVTVEG